MRLLLTSDLHCDVVKMRWLLNHAPAHDALLVAGDLLNIFSDDGAALQIGEVKQFHRVILESGRALVFSSGNHDFFDSIDTSLCAASPRWISELPERAEFVGDGESRLLDLGFGKVVITTIPWPVHGGRIFLRGESSHYLDYIEQVIDCGQRLRERHHSPWIIVTHEPPAGSPVIGTFVSGESEFTRRIIERASPDFSLHGHVHEAPQNRGGSWHCRIERTVCFNAGQTRLGEIPNYIAFEIDAAEQSWTAEWYVSGELVDSVG
jgi:Icc-related predicted phosphoesterase